MHILFDFPPDNGCLFAGLVNNAFFLSDFFRQQLSDKLRQSEISKMFENIIVALFLLNEIDFGG